MSKMDLHIGREAGATPTLDASQPASSGAIALRDFVMPLAIIGALVALVLTLGVHYAVRVFDISNAERERVLTQNGIDKRVAEVAQMVVPQADWDDAVIHLDNRFDPDWSRANVGSFLYQTNGFDRAFVIDRNDALLEGYREGAVADPSTYAALAPQLDALIASVRAKEAARGDFTLGRRETMISSPIQESALTRVGDGVEIVTATLVQPDFGTAIPRETRAPIIVTTMPIDAAFLQAFARRYLLEDLHLLPEGERPAPGENGLPIFDAQGKPLAMLAWTPLSPGYAMLRDMIVPIVVVSLLLIALVIWQLRKVRRMAGKLIEREAFWREIATHEQSIDVLDHKEFVEHLAFELGCLGEVSESLAVVAIGLDVGDREVSPREHERLCQVALSRLKHICRDDAIVGRTGESEIAILAVGVGEQGAQALHKRAYAALAASFMLDGREIDTRPAVGAAVSTGPNDSALALLERARNMQHAVAI